MPRDPAGGTSTYSKCTTEEMPVTAWQSCQLRLPREPRPGDTGSSLASTHLSLVRPLEPGLSGYGQGPQQIPVS